MPFSIPHKLLFIHIPKNAGTSVSQAFRMENFGHFTIEQCKDQISPKLWQEFHKFCIVRNPFDRIVSCYEYARMPKSYHHSVTGYSNFGKHPDYDTLKNMSFEDCVKLLGTNELRHQGWTPQSDWVIRDGVFALDEFVKCEDLGDTYRGVSIKSINKSTRKEYREYFSNSETIKTVEEYYKEDLERFGYEF